MKRSERTEILQHALLGYQIQRGEIDRRIAELQQRLNGAVVPKPGEKPKRRLSPEGRA